MRLKLTVLAILICGISLVRASAPSESFPKITAIVHRDGERVELAPIHAVSLELLQLSAGPELKDRDVVRCQVGQEMVEETHPVITLMCGTVKYGLTKVLFVPE